MKAKLKSNIHFKEILTGSAITFVLKMFGMLLGYIVVLMISRQYGAKGIGVYNLTLSLMTFAAMIAAMGMNISILRYVGQFNKSGEEYKLKLLYRYAVEFVVPFSLLLAMLLYFLADVIAQKIFHNPVYRPALEFAAVIVPFMALQNISVEFIRGLKQLKISEYLRSVNRPLVNITLLSSIGFYVVDDLLPLYTMGTGVVISVCISVYIIIKKLNKIAPASSESFTRKELVTTSSPMMITTVASFVMGNISLWFLGIFSTTEEVGVFSVVFKIAMLISLVLVVVNTASAPKFSELYWNDEQDKLQTILTYSAKIILSISFVMAMIIIILSKNILSIFGTEFIAGYVSLIFMVIGKLFNSFTSSDGIILNMTGNQKTLRNIVLFSLAINFFLNYLLIPKYGINGAAFATMMGTIVLNSLSVLYVKYKLKLVTYYFPF